MSRKIMFLAGIFIFLVFASGCATARKQANLETQGLRNQVSALESQLQAKDEEINSLRDALKTAAETKEAAPKKKIVCEVKSHPSVKQIQIALKNAGYNPGRCDGKTGKQTRNAIRDFQRANNLPADGRVGKKTWNLLKAYLYKKVK